MDSVAQCEKYYQTLNYQSVASQNGRSVDSGEFLMALLGKYASSQKQVPLEKATQAMEYMSDLVLYGSPDEATLNVDYKKERESLLKSPFGLQLQNGIFIENIENIENSIAQEETTKTR